MCASYLLKTFIYSVFILAIGFLTTSVVGTAEEKSAGESQ